MKSWLVPLSWDFLVSTLTHPSKDLHISTLFGAPVNFVFDKFSCAPTGPGFCRRGALACRNGTKRQGRPYHVCTCVIRVVDSKDTPLALFGASRASTSLSLSSLHALLARNSRNGETRGNVVKNWAIPLSWDFLVSTQHIQAKSCTLLPSSELRSTMWAISLALLLRG